MHSLIIHKQLMFMKIWRTIIQQIKGERRVLTVFDDMIADTESNGRQSPIVTELF